MLTQGLNQSERGKIFDSGDKLGLDKIWTRTIFNLLVGAKCKIQLHVDSTLCNFNWLEFQHLARYWNQYGPKIVWGSVAYQDVCPTLTLCFLLSLSVPRLLALCFLSPQSRRRFCTVLKHNTPHITLCFLIVVNVLFVRRSWESLPLPLRTLRAVTRLGTAALCWFFSWHCLVWH